MSKNAHATAQYRIINGAGGNQYQFFCELSGALVCKTKIICADTQEKELHIAWNTEGRQHFNLCRQCGKWVSNVMYNPDVLECVDCCPLENQPHFCLHCGTEVLINDVYCRKCGTRLRYGEVVSDDNGTA